jgi:hypothetical protein
MAAVAPLPPGPAVAVPPAALAPAGTVVEGGTAALAPPTAREAFLRVFNWRNVAITFYVCLLLVIARTAANLSVLDLESWLFYAVRFLRQTLISGNLILLAIACTDALAAPRSWSRRPAFLLAAGLTTIGASLSVLARWTVADTPLARIVEFPHYPAALVVLWMSIGTLGYAIYYLLRESARERDLLCEAETRREALHAQIVQANLSALQAQIEPHFLFNTLANVKRLYETSPGTGREMLVSLIGYLRAALPSMRRAGSTVARELELVRAYLTILELRMGERLRFAIDCDPALADAAVPPMMVPTLVENAIKHGLQPLPEGGRIDIRVSRRAGERGDMRADMRGESGEAARDDLQIEVSDTGAGFRATSGSGVGLANIRSRLAALYGARGALTLAAGHPRGVVATLRVPLQAGGGQFTEGASA